jgi:hypothetical protein
LVVVRILLDVLIMVSIYKYDVLTNDALAELWDMLVTSKREVSKVKQNIVLTYSSVAIVDDR